MRSLHPPMPRDDARDSTGTTAGAAPTRRGNIDARTADTATDASALEPARSGLAPHPSHSTRAAIEAPGEGAS